jgi:hypothetical protein
MTTINTEYGSITLNSDTVDGILKNAEDLINKVPGVDIDITGGGESSVSDQVQGFWVKNKKIILVSGAGLFGILILGKIFNK